MSKQSVIPAKAGTIKSTLLTAILAFPIMAAVCLPIHALKKGGHVKAALVSETQSVQPGTPFWVAVELKMDPHWHTYWKNPGESGEVTAIEWKLPAGFSAGPIQWPAPKVIAVPPVVSYGYEDNVLLLTQITPPATFADSKAVKLDASVDWLECEATCIPGSADVSLSLPVSLTNPKPNAEWQEKFSKTRFHTPLPSSEWSFEAHATADGYKLIGHAPAGSAPPKDAYFYSDEPGVVAYTTSQDFQPNASGFSLTLKKSDAATAKATTLKGVVVTSSGWRGEGSEPAVEINAPVSSAPAQNRFGSIWKALLFALIGGMILNLMPCVLPILSIKILGFVKQAQGSRSHSIAHGLTFAAGVILSFVVLAGALLILRAGGEKLGWGFHLQSPGFVIALMSLFFLLALSMFGVFEIGTSFIQLGGSGKKAGSEFLNSFFSGVLATAVATPCTAPFMGSALGYAIAQPPVIALSVFITLGIGMALPYVLLSCFPSLLRFVPKPGPWMDTFKQVMAFFLLATVLWLAWVLQGQRAGNALVYVLAGLLIQSIGAWAWGRWNTPVKSIPTQRIGLAAALLFFIVGLTVALKARNEAAVGTAALSGAGERLIWEPYSSSKVESLRKEGKPVFVDFTASWCLTCQVNERVVLNDPEVVAAFKKSGMALLKADWTNRDEEITRALESFDRSGVPFYVIYPSDASSSPRPLPEILSKSIVLKAIGEVN